MPTTRQRKSNWPDPKRNGHNTHFSPQLKTAHQRRRRQGKLWLRCKSQTKEWLARVKKSLDSNIGTITLQHPEKRNALSAELIADSLEALASLTASGARVVVLRAAPGVKVWSAGHDVKELPTNGRDPLTYDDPCDGWCALLRKCQYP